MPDSFGPRLLAWHRQNPRPLPWAEGRRDPYHIWVSEIILQQTRLAQGAAYYHRFIARFPDIAALARAAQDDVLHAWEGLGYYTRARNLHAAARMIVDRFDGEFPTTYAEILSLPGIGPYSAAAISSFAFGLPHVVVDGNVKRVIARYTGMIESIDTPAAHRHIEVTASGFMGSHPPGEFNQAIMNFGALVCKPANPDCPQCPMQKACVAYRHQQTSEIPVRSPKKQVRPRFFHFIVLLHRGRIAMISRTASDVWKDLYTPPMIESISTRKPAITTINRFVSEAFGVTGLRPVSSSEPLRQLLSHQQITGRFHAFELSRAPANKHSALTWADARAVSALSKPRIVRTWLASDHARQVWPSGHASRQV